MTELVRRSTVRLHGYIACVVQITRDPLQSKAAWTDVTRRPQIRLGIPVSISFEPDVGIGWEKEGRSTETQKTARIFGYDDAGDNALFMDAV
jgi:hypothetical protein